MFLKVYSSSSILDRTLIMCQDDRGHHGRHQLWSQGNLATGHISGAITQIVCLAVDALICVGFFKKADKRKVQAQMANAKKAETQA